MTTRIAAIAFAVCTVLAAQTKLLPVDESASDPQFSGLYETFRIAVSQKNAAILMSILDPEVQSEIDGDKGPEAFEKRWTPAGPSSKVWTQLATIINLGGSFSTEQGTKMFCAPYTYSKFPDSIESFDHGVILNASVEVRSRPNEHAPVITKLSHEIVKVPSWETTPDESHNIQWVRVVTRAGTGYVHTSDIRSPLDSRVCFHRKNGRWLLRWLVAGD